MTLEEIFNESNILIIGNRVHNPHNAYTIKISNPDLSEDGVYCHDEMLHCGLKYPWDHTEIIQIMVFILILILSEIC